VYSAVLHYLKAVKALKSDSDGRAVVEQMKKMPTDDPAFGKGSIRQDGRKLHPMYLYEVKKPSESKGPWDYYKLVKEVPPDQAFRPLDKGECPLVTAQK
jgi:branched-chain amino acid transport system substrate-binding protein